MNTSLGITIIMQNVREVEERSSARQVPAISFEIEETEGTVSQSHELFSENELVEKNASAHICHCNACHEQKSTNDKTLRPRLEDEIFI